MTFLFKKIRQFFKWLYRKLFRINDSPQRVALGFGLGVFLGILPGLGPIAAVTLALLFKVNRAAALTGSLLTNTWLSLATFLVSLKIGAWITGQDWQMFYQQCSQLMEDFHWKYLFESAPLHMLIPLFVGYMIIGSAAGFLAYGLVFISLYIKEIKNNSRFTKT